MSCPTCPWAESELQRSGSICMKQQVECPRSLGSRRSRDRAGAVDCDIWKTRPCNVRRDSRGAIDRSSSPGDGHRPFVFPLSLCVLLTRCFVQTLQSCPMPSATHDCTSNEVRCLFVEHVLVLHPFFLSALKHLKRLSSLSFFWFLMKHIRAFNAFSETVMCLIVLMCFFFLSQSRQTFMKKNTFLK